MSDTLPLTANIENTQRRTVLLALDYYDYRLHKGVSQVAAKEGWNLICTQSMASTAAVPGDWHGHGIISLVASDASERMLEQHDVPRIELGLEPSSLPLIRVIPDNQQIGEMAADYFIQRGIRSFIIETNTDGFIMLEQRKAAFVARLNQLRDEGYPIETHLLFNPVNHSFDTVSTSDVENTEIAETLQDIEKPCAYLGYDDEMAMHFMECVRHIGFHVPEDFLVLGVDDNDLLCEGLDITLSSINTDLVGVGEKAAEKLAQQFALLPEENHQSKTNNDLEAGLSLKNDIVYWHQPKKIVTRRSTDQYASSHPIINQALCLVAQRLNDNQLSTTRKPIPNANQLAEHFGLTQQGLQNIFREHYHCSPATAIRQLCLRHAKQLLLEKKSSLKEVAYQAGFSSTEALSRCFKQHFGVTPGKWRSLSK